MRALQLDNETLGTRRSGLETSSKQLMFFGIIYTECLFLIYSVSYNIKIMLDSVSLQARMTASKKRKIPCLRSF